MQQYSSTAAAISSREQQCILQTYKRKSVVFAKGEGSYLIDESGKPYLDMGSGIAVNALGYQHKVIVDAIREQSEQLIHCSNLYFSRPMVEFAEELVANSFGAKVFFCNSGTEANEAALKFGRRAALQKDNSGKKHRFVTFKHGFHGRTFGALSVTPKASIQEPFRPLLTNVTVADFNDAKIVSTNVTNDVAAVIVEPIQGEGGVLVAQKEFLAALRAACDQVDATLIFDEVQCGLGRTGTLWAYEQFGVVPDIMTLAKPLGGGLPLGAVIVNERIASAIAYGDHGSTFGGNPLATHVGLKVFQTIAQPTFLADVCARGKELERILHDAQAKFPHRITAVRGHGLMWGVDTAEASDAIVERGLAQGLVLLTAGEKTLRLLPPLTITSAQLKQFAEIFAKILT